MRQLALALLLVASGAGAQGVPARVMPAAGVRTPADLYGPLFHAVQMRRIFPDGKTFVDAVAKRPASVILAAYRRERPADDAALKRFVLAHFDVPSEASTVVSDTARPTMAAHITGLWRDLARPPLTPAAGSSALALPAPYVVPGGRFREPYYWDSYFTMLGLKADGRADLIDGMIDDFASLVERYGHVPNGARTYYVSRSQPPFLYLMMGLSEQRTPAVQRRRLAALRAEHAYWMRGAGTVSAKVPAAARVVRMPDGAVLNRYYDDRDTPRDESYREDVLTAQASGRPAAEVYRDLRAGAESGWDYSSRWLGDGRTLKTIRTTAIIPVDLNALLYGQERAIAVACKALADAICARDFDGRAERRRAAVERWLWAPGQARYGDYDWQAGVIRTGLSAATAYPLFTGLAAPDRARAVAKTIADTLLAPGGLRTTTVRTGQQWDTPNGWAPLQWVGHEALRVAGDTVTAQLVATRFMMTAEREYRRSGKMLEKYDVEKSRAGGGGEYPTQDGFGWTNGVVRAFQVAYPVQ